MGVLFLLIVLFHGLIHVLGFIKAFGFFEVKQLTHQISKPIGLAWLLTTILFLMAAGMFIYKNQSWGYFMLPAILISQVLIFLSWQDAKFGTIANVLILGLACYLFFVHKP